MTYTGDDTNGPMENPFIPSNLVGHRDDWYLYAKAERIGRAIVRLLSYRPESSVVLSSRIVECVLDFVSFASEAVVQPSARDDLAFRTLELSALVRLAGSAGLFDQGSVFVLSEELQKFSDRISALRGGFGLAIDERMLMIDEPQPTPQPIPPHGVQKSFYAGTSHAAESKTHKPQADSGQNMSKVHASNNKRQMTDRSQMVLDVVKEKGTVSIRGIASAISGCSEKTIQRELNALIEKGLVKRQGERRWSTYSLS